MNISTKYCNLSKYYIKWRNQFLDQISRRNDSQYVPFEIRRPIRDVKRTTLSLIN